MSRSSFKTHEFSVCIVRHPDGRWLAVKEAHQLGWWLPAGMVDPGENFEQAGLRETLEEAGIDIALKGILKVDYSLCDQTSARMRVIYYAEPIDPQQKPKDWKDQESDLAEYLTLEQIKDLKYSDVGLRGGELIEWATYVEKGGLIYPLSVMSPERTQHVDLQNNTIQIQQNVFTMPKTFPLTIEDLRSAVTSGNDFTLKDCLLQGMDPNSELNTKQWTTMHYAVRYRHASCVKTLLLCNVDLSKQTHYNRNIVQFAAQSTTEILALVLFKAQQNGVLDLLNVQDKEGETALHWAYTGGNSKNVELLIQYGADQTIVNQEGKPPNQA